MRGAVLSRRGAAHERFVQQHFAVCLVPQTPGPGLPSRQRKLVVTRTDRDLARSGREDSPCFSVDRSTVPIEVCGETFSASILAWQWPIIRAKPEPPINERP